MRLYFTVSLLHFINAVWSMPPHPLLYGIGRGDGREEDERRREEVSGRKGAGGGEGGGGRSEELRNAFSGTSTRIGT